MEEAKAMGACASSEHRDNNAIEQEMAAAKKDDRKIVKTLMLGTGASGKSTIFKQMILMNGGDIKAGKKKHYHEFCMRNALSAMMSILMQAKIFAEELKREECVVDSRIKIELNSN